MEDMVGVAAAAMAGLAAAATADLAGTRRLWGIVAAASVVRTLVSLAAGLPAARTLGLALTPDSGRVAFVGIATGRATDSGIGGDMGILIMGTRITDTTIRFWIRGGGVRGRHLIRTMHNNSRWPSK